MHSLHGLKDKKNQNSPKKKKSLPCKGARWPAVISVCGKRRCHTAPTQPGPWPPAPSTACCTQRSPGCRWTRPWPATTQCVLSVYSDVYRRVETAERTERPLHLPGPPLLPLPLCGWGEKRKAGQPAGSTGLLRAADVPTRWTRRSQPRGRLHSPGGNPRAPGLPQHSWDGRRGCTEAEKTCDCRCAWATSPRSHRRRYLSTESLGEGPDWFWLHDCEKTN